MANWTLPYGYVFGILGLNSGVGALNKTSRLVCGICCHGNDHVAIATKEGQSSRNKSHPSTDSIATPLIRAPQEGQLTSIIIEWQTEHPSWHCPYGQHWYQVPGEVMHFQTMLHSKLMHVSWRLIWPNMSIRDCVNHFSICIQGQATRPHGTCQVLEAKLHKEELTWHIQVDTTHTT